MRHHRQGLAKDAISAAKCDLFIAGKYCTSILTFHDLTIPNNFKFRNLIDVWDFSTLQVRKRFWLISDYSAGNWEEKISVPCCSVPHWATFVVSLYYPMRVFFPSSVTSDKSKAHSAEVKDKRRIQKKKKKLPCSLIQFALMLWMPILQV